MNNENYFVGLDIGTDSVGYAVTDTSENYRLLKFHGEPMWGVSLFDPANMAEQRRAFRTARRRLVRRKQRVSLLQELFKSEIDKVDPKFFDRIKESALLRTDAQEPYCLFNDDSFTDKQYHKKYPTIHHLICDLLESKECHDIRLIYIACAWLLVHRGHFLSEVSEENVDELLDFKPIYSDLMSFLEETSGEDYMAPWSLDSEKTAKLEEVLKKESGVTRKYEDLRDVLLGGNKPSKKIEPGFPYSLEGIIKLLAGGTYKLSDLFGKEEYADLSSFNLAADDEALEEVYRNIGDDSDLLKRLKALYDWSVLADLSKGEYLSKAKVFTYEQHKKDLDELKKYVNRFCKDRYNEIFRRLNKDNDNYVSYSGNTKSLTEEEKGKYKKCSSQDKFCEYLKSVLKVDDKGNPENMPEEMRQRILNKTFMPKQVSGDNRVIPYQLYYVELKKILENASKFYSFLLEKDNGGYITKDKVLSIMRFRVPYYVGPLNKNNNEHAWIERKAEGKIYPWNFEEKVDLEKSEEKFIDRMTNTCSYIAGAEVLPKHSLLYEKFEVLNEINNLKINGISISVEAKQMLFHELFERRKKVTVKQIKNKLCERNYCTKEDVETLSGIDTDVKSSLSAYLAFSHLLESGALKEADVENIIVRQTYSEDKVRFKKWLDREYSCLSHEDRKYISSLRFKEFGRLSRELLQDISEVDVSTGEMISVIGLMWQTNLNLSELLLSDRFNLKKQIEDINKEYYAQHPTTLTERLDELYVSNAVKRPIIRTLEVMKDIVKATGKAPEKIFVEMAKGATEDQKNKRTISRKQQLLDLYKKVKFEDVRELSKMLDEETDNHLQSDKLFLYYMQLGHDMYSWKPIEIEQLGMGDKYYNIDHIYPQSYVKDDSILNNRVLVSSIANGEKRNEYPIASEIRFKMHNYWTLLRDNGLITEEKYKRLVRNTPFTEEEQYGFINRQLVETRQSTKVITKLLQERYPNSQIIYVKAGIVSEFRHNYKLLKSRTINDLHHAKDAFLNVVCGNVYHEKFTRKWFERTKGTKEYTINQEKILARKIVSGEKVVWEPSTSFAAVRNTMSKNNAHMTFYSIKKKQGQNGGFFDQNPLKADEELFPRKANLPAEKYGGYNGLTTSFSVLVRYQVGKKREVEFVPVVLLSADRFLTDKEYALSYVKQVINPKASNVEILLDGRIIKINTVLQVGSLRLLFGGQGSKDTRIGFKVFEPLYLSYEWEQYVKAIESFADKCAKNSKIVYSEKYDQITKEKNTELFSILCEKMSKSPYSIRPESQSKKVKEAQPEFVKMDEKKQVQVLLNTLSYFSRSARSESSISLGNACRMNAKLSNWSNISDIRILDYSPSGLWEQKSCNLKDLQ